MPRATPRAAGLSAVAVALLVAAYFGWLLVGQSGSEKTGKLGLTTVAECIEDAETAARVRDCCLSPPITSERLLKMFRRPVPAAARSS